MRLRNILIPLAVPVILVSCDKAIQPRDLNFSVASFNNAKQASTTFKVGDTVNFVFTGNPDQIVFFSGEKGKRYQYSTRTADSTSTIDTLKFTTALNTAGNGTPQLLVSTGFPQYTQVNTTDSTNIKATYPNGWTDISNRATWATNGTALVTKVGLNDFAAAGKPITLAFRYAANASVAQSKWTISALGLRHYVADTSYCIDSTNWVNPTTFPASVVSPGWGVVSVANPAIKFALSNVASNPVQTILSQTTGTTNANFTVTGNTSAATAVSTETWIISGPINLYRVIPDGGGIFVKDMTSNAAITLYGTGGINSSWANFAYKFTRPGTYNATFLATADSKDTQTKVPYVVTITVQ